jgi:hypothetical protein
VGTERLESGSLTAAARTPRHRRENGRETGRLAVRQNLPAGAGKPWLSCATLVGMSKDDHPVKRRLIAMLSTEGKSKAQMKAEAREALRKYLQAQRPPPDDAAPQSR